jgi:chitinase
VLGFGAFAADKPQNQKKQIAANPSTEENYDQVKEEFVKYMNSVPTNTKDEIKNFRSEIRQLNKQKSALYQALSQEAQGVLKQEAVFKRKLSFQQRRDFMKEAYGNDTESNIKDASASKPSKPAAPKTEQVPQSATLPTK